MSDFDAKFTSQADTSGAKKMEGAVKDVHAASNQKGGSFFDDLKKHSVELFDHIKDEFPVVDKLSGLFTKLATGPVGLLATGIGALAATVEVAKESFEEFANFEAAYTKLDAALAQTGQLTDEYREKLHALAGEMQNATGLADEQWLEVFKRLTQFGADSSNIDRYAEAVKNLAGIIGGDITTAAMMFSRAMQGNFTLFSRYGIHVEDAATKTEKLNKLMEQLALRGGGQLEASTKTINGQFQQLSLSIADLLKSIGSYVAQLQIVQSVTGALTELIRSWNEAIGISAPKVEGLTNSLKPLTLALDENAEAAGSTKSGMDSIAAAADRAAAALERATRALENNKRRQDALSNANMALELQNVEDNPDLSDAEKLEQSAAIRQRYAKEAFDREQQNYQNQIDANRKYISDTQNQVDNRRQGVRDQYKRVDQANDLDTQEAQLQKTMRGNSEAIETTEKKIADIEKQNQERPEMAGINEIYLKELKADLERLERFADKYKEAIERISGDRKAQGLGSGAQESKRLADLEEQFKSFVEKVGPQIEQAGDAATQAGYDKETAARVFPINQKVEAGKAGSAITKARDKEIDEQGEETKKNAEGFDKLPIDEQLRQLNPELLSKRYESGTTTGHTARKLDDLLSKLQQNPQDSSLLEEILGVLQKYESFAVTSTGKTSELVLRISESERRIQQVEAQLKNTPTR